MIQQQKILGVSLALALSAGLFAQQSVEPAGSGRGATAAIDQVLADAVRRGDIPGVVGMAADSRGILYQGAFGMADATRARPMALDTIFRIASMTKPVTSLALMQLVEQGKLSLDDPAEQHLPQLANLNVFETFDTRTGQYTVRPARTKPTVRHLLTHTAGFGYSFTSPIVRDFKPRPGETYSAGPLLFEPGEQWLYSTGIDWAGRLVESISGKSLEEYFRDHIFAPLKMADTFYNPPDDRQPRLAAVHRRGLDARFDLDGVQPAMSVKQFIGGGGLASTASDYLRFLRMFLNQGALDGARVVSPGTVAVMGRNHERSSDFTFVADGRDKWGIRGICRSTCRSPTAGLWRCTTASSVPSIGWRAGRAGRELFADSDAAAGFFQWSAL